MSEDSESATPAAERPVEQQPVPEPVRPLLNYFLCRRGDHRGRLVTDVLAYDDRAFAEQPGFAEWLFPLFTPSKTVPEAPALTQDERDAIRGSPLAMSHLLKGRDRAQAFFENSDGWLKLTDPEHHRITRIIASLNILADFSVAGRFHDAILRRMLASGRAVNAQSQFEWQRARSGGLS